MFPVPQDTSVEQVGPDVQTSQQKSSMSGEPSHVQLPQETPQNQSKTGQELAAASSYIAGMLGALEVHKLSINSLERYTFRRDLMRSARAMNYLHFR